MTNEALKLLAYLQGRADRNTGHGTVLLETIYQLCKHYSAVLVELENAGEIHDRREDDGMLHYRVQKD